VKNYRAGEEVVRLRINRSRGGGKFFKREVLKDYFLFWRLSTKESTMSKIGPEGGKK
jgi:hypothetical protein